MLVLQIGVILVWYLSTVSFKDSVIIYILVLVVEKENFMA